jgi:S1-C subfamily serine protease
MKLVYKITKTLCVSLAFVGANSAVSFATDPGSMEAINSASDERRNIIGIEISTATDAQLLAAGCKEKGVLVSAVIPKHPAAIAGLKAGDVITHIDGNPVTETSQALERMNDLDAGRSYPFVICRAKANGISEKLVVNVLIEKVQEKVIGKIS